MSRFHSFFPGGWLLVSNVVVDDPSSRQLSIESSYREISNCHDNKALFITKDAMKELRTHLSFTQLRFHCSKQKGPVQSTWLPLLTALVKLLYSISAVRRIPAPWAIAVTRMNVDRLTAVICYTFQLAFKLVHNNSRLNNMTHQGMVCNEKKRSF